jgi:hypothetical protein
MALVQSSARIGTSGGLVAQSMARDFTWAEIWASRRPIVCGNIGGSHLTHFVRGGPLYVSTYARPVRRLVGIPAPPARRAPAPHLRAPRALPALRGDRALLPWFVTPYCWDKTDVIGRAYHAFITDRDGETLALEADHRRHAEIENAIRDLKYGMALNPVRQEVAFLVAKPEAHSRAADGLSGTRSTRAR